MVQAIVAILRQHPHPLPAKAITRYLQHQFPGIKKNEVNSTLYSNREIFQSAGQNPPLWGLRASAQTVSSPAQPPQQPGRPLHARQWAQGELPGLGEALDALPPAPEIPAGLKSPARNLFPWQVQALRSWQSSGGRGVVEAVTGSGKSMVAIQLLYYFIKARRRCLILVPTTALQNQWHEEIRLHLGFTPISHFGGSPGARYRPEAALTIGIVNSVANQASAMKDHFNLIIADEAHRYGAAVFRRALLDSTPFRLGLTATLERSDDGVEEVLRPYFRNSSFVYDFPRARKERVVARYAAIFLGVSLDPEEKATYDNLGSIMGRQRSYLKRSWPSKYDGISFGEFIARAALAAQRSDSEGLAARAYIAAMTQRRRILAESTVKVRCAERLSRAARVAKKSVFFCETQAAAESIADRLQAKGLVAEAHHSTIHEEERAAILDRLKHGNLEAVVAVHTLDEGVDVPNLVLGVVVAGTKQRRQMIQRMGRVLRKKPDDRKAVFVIIYAKGTAEDPGLGINGEESHFDVLVENADQKELLDTDIISIEEAGDRVAAFVSAHVGEQA